MTDSAVNRSIQGCGRILTHVYAEDINLYKKAGQCPYIQVTIKKNIYVSVQRDKWNTW